MIDDCFLWADGHLDFSKTSLFVDYGPTSGTVVRNSDSESVHEMSRLSPYCPPPPTFWKLSWSIIRHPNSSLMWTVQKIYLSENSQYQHRLHDVIIFSDSLPMRSNFSVTWLTLFIIEFSINDSFTLIIPDWLKLDFPEDFNFRCENFEEKISQRKIQETFWSIFET